MRQYSEANQALILQQMPEATEVKSFNQWKAAGRSVMKGEKAIRIWAPRTRKNKAEVKTNADRMLLDALGEKEEEIKKLGFVRVSVFDISQTEPIEAFEARKAERAAAKTA